MRAMKFLRSAAGAILLLGLLYGCAANKSSPQGRHERKEKEEEAKEKELAREREQDEKPDWVRMMDDPNVNYFQAVNAFERFMKEQEEAEGEEQRERAGEARSLEEEENEGPYSTDIKRFNAWKRNMYPYVQPDGSILSPEQQMEVWKNQRK